MRTAAPSAQEHRDQQTERAMAVAALEQFVSAHPEVLELEVSERRRKEEEHNHQMAAEDARRAAFWAEVDRIRGTQEASPEAHAEEMAAWLREKFSKGADPVLAWYAVSDKASNTPWGRSWTEREWERAKELVHAQIAGDA